MDLGVMPFYCTHPSMHRQKLNFRLFWGVSFEMAVFRGIFDFRPAIISHTYLTLLFQSPKHFQSPLGYLPLCSLCLYDL